MIYEPMLHSDVKDKYIKYKTYDEYYDKLLDSNKYKKLMERKNVIETEINFCYREVNRLEPMY